VRRLLGPHDTLPCVLIPELCLLVVNGSQPSQCPIIAMFLGSPRALRMSYANFLWHLAHFRLIWLLLCWAAMLSTVAALITVLQSGQRVSSVHSDSWSQNHDNSAKRFPFHNSFLLVCLDPGVATLCNQVSLSLQCAIILWQNDKELHQCCILCLNGKYEY